MRRLVSLIVLLLFLPVASVLAGDLPDVLQPNTTAYSASEVGILTQAIATLAEALNDYNMASRRYFSPNDWSSRDFAMYTAGVLSGKGYNTILVSEDGWLDGVHTWVLVGIPLGSKTAWIPVEAAPGASHSQRILGHIPSTTNDAGTLWFENSYLNFREVIELPSNLPPIPNIRPPALAVNTGEMARLLALGSYDPDGEIILYQWIFGDGGTETRTAQIARHEFNKPAVYPLSLTVVDNRGTSASTSFDLRVVAAEAGESPPSGGCGCGK